jgi:hypothetical protein
MCVKIDLKEELATHVFDEILGLQCGLGGAGRSGKGFAEDYYLDAKSQCAGKRGACPDRCVSSGVELL